MLFKTYISYILQLYSCSINFETKGTRIISISHPTTLVVFFTFQINKIPFSSISLHSTSERTDSKTITNKIRKKKWELIYIQFYLKYALNRQLTLLILLDQRCSNVRHFRVLNISTIQFRLGPKDHFDEVHDFGT